MANIGRRLSGREIGLMGVFFFCAVFSILFFLSRDGYVVEVQGTVAQEIENVVEEIDPSADIEKQKPLSNPPKQIKAIYATGFSAGSEKKVEYFLDLINNTELNAIVIDVKDYTGNMMYKPDYERVLEYGSYINAIGKINRLIKKFHDNGIYVIARISVFQDAALVKIKPEWAVRSKSTGEIWGDRKGVTWMDSAAIPVWDYNISIAKDALNRGFDEIILIIFDFLRMG